MTPVATATAIPASRLHGHHDRPSMVSVGTIIWLSSELMFFAALFASYFTIRAVSPELWAENTELLNIPFATANTTILVLSSVTCQLGVFAAERGQVGRTGSVLNVKGWGLREWFILTYVMGAVFIAGQATEYAALVAEGMTIQDSAYGTMFYLTTGFHGLHVTGGLIAFLFVLGRTYVARKFTHEQAVSAIVVSYYWHFVDVVWIGLFATIYLVK
ncbi:heme-copper oxidase subunit III [Nocardioides sp. SR21]|uniref:aa3-type cytochrome oxidase subunit III n=1 Tax=Nocardioides sp. SR21 TaxID=2919501 RepID=UPI0024311FA9|nr:heme-copper oxidase subunit III [Nocardioides sp. SR21]